MHSLASVSSSVRKSRRAKKRQKQESAWSEDSGEELIFDLVGREIWCDVRCAWGTVVCGWKLGV